MGHRVVCGQGDGEIGAILSALGREAGRRASGAMSDAVARMAALVRAGLTYKDFRFLRAPQTLLEREPEWAAPVLWRSEFRNILAGYVRRKSLTFDQACSLHIEAQSLLAGSEFEVDSRTVLELVRDSDCSAYDCEFVALAIRLDTKLVTLDKKLLRAFPTRVLALAAA